MIKEKNQKIIVFALLLMLLLGANFVYALEINYPRIPGAIPPQDFLKTSPQEDFLSLYLQYIVNSAIWLAGILALVMLVYGGILYLFSTGKPGAMVTARNQIISAFFGLLLVLSSFLILKTINPEFVILKLPSLQAPQIPLLPDIKPPEITAIQSSIDAEMPFSRIIEKLFETYLSEYPQPKDPEDPRMLRIKNISRAVIGDDKDKGLADKLKDQSQVLKEAADKCSCRQTDPDPACGGNKSGNTTWKCDCGSCSDKKSCTCDPCKKVRGDIQNAETENLKAIYNGTEINQFDEQGKKKKITTSLVKEQEKTEEEIRLLKEELDRLKRAEKFIDECPLRSLNSLAQFYLKEDSYKKQNWTVREINFWDNVNIRYYSGEYTKNIYGSWYYQPTKEIGTDFATFYCSVSGTLEEPNPFPVSMAPSQSALGKAQTAEEAEGVATQSMACSDEAPAGEIIDRAKRVTQLLINKLETLIEWEKKLIDAVDKLQVLISQCSSQRGCERRCTCFNCGCGDDPCIDLCQGWIYCCADSSPAYGQGPCLDRDEDTPCPYAEIKKQLEEIQKIWQEIKDLVEGKGDNDTPETIGIMPLIEEVIPKILEDLGNNVRTPMHQCSSQNWTKLDKVLFNCQQSQGATNPEGRVIRFCCQTEAWDQNTGKIVQTPFGDCFEECYLKKGIEEHGKCAQDCLDKKAQQLNDPDLARCFHELNFYCCNVKK